MPHSECYIDEVWFPSVTTILASKPKPWVIRWQEKWGIRATRKMEIAGAIGTEFHRCVDSWLNTGGYVVLPPMIGTKALLTAIPRVHGMMTSFIKWANSIDGTIAVTEMKIVSMRHRYSGTLDAVGTIDKKHMILDWKTSSAIYDEMQLQLAAYAEAWNEMMSLPKKTAIKLGLIVCVSKDKPLFKVTTKMFKLGKRPFNEFLKLREAFDAKADVPEETGC